MATSVALSVRVIGPSLKFCVTAATLTPRPTPEPANISANEVVAPLKPFVAELAILLPIESSPAEAAFKPLTACEKTYFLHEYWGKLRRWINFENAAQRDAFAQCQHQVMVRQLQESPLTRVYPSLVTSISAPELTAFTSK